MAFVTYRIPNNRQFESASATTRYLINKLESRHHRNLAPTTTTALWFASFNDDEATEEEPEKEDSISLDEFLDAPFFDPDQFYDPDSNGDEATNDNASFLIRPFARLVKEDYEMAEALYSGVFLAFMIVISQELFRFWLYGENYIPFQPGGALGSINTWKSY